MSASHDRGGFRAVLSEFVGTLFLLAMVVGSGIMAEGLAGGNQAIALLANALATGAGLFVLIQCLGPISGAHLNPAVSVVEWSCGRMGHASFLSYVSAQVGGGAVGVLLAHSLFDLPLVQAASKARFGLHLWGSEFVATLGLLATIHFSQKRGPDTPPLSIAAYVTSAYWFTSSTSFANPAVTFARMFTDTFCGIHPAGVLPFMLAQFGAACAFAGILRWSSRAS